MKLDEVILVGAGGHALSLSEFAHGRVCGYLSKERNPQMQAEWLGTDEVLKDWIGKDLKFHMAFVYAGLPVMESRRKLIEFYEKAGAEFETLVAPTAIVTPSSELGDGCAVMAGAIVNRAYLGRNVIVNSGAIVEHDCNVGDNTFIGPGAVVGGFTTIGRNCFIGLGVKIGNGIRIEDNITIAMGAVVNRNLSEPGIYHGPNLKLFRLRK